MSCKCASISKDCCMWVCSITGDQCMYMIPNSKQCAKDYGEGPDANNESEGDK